MLSVVIYEPKVCTRLNTLLESKINGVKIRNSMTAKTENDEFAPEALGHWLELGPNADCL